MFLSARTENLGSFTKGLSAKKKRYASYRDQQGSPELAWCWVHTAGFLSTSVNEWLLVVVPRCSVPVPTGTWGFLIASSRPWWPASCGCSHWAGESELQLSCKSWAVPSPRWRQGRARPPVGIITSDAGSIYRVYSIRLPPSSLWLHPPVLRRPVLLVQQNLRPSKSTWERRGRARPRPPPRPPPTAQCWWTRDWVCTCVTLDFTSNASRVFLERLHVTLVRSCCYFILLRSTSLMKVFTDPDACVLAGSSQPVVVAVGVVLGLIMCGSCLLAGVWWKRRYCILKPVDFRLI